MKKLLVHTLTLFSFFYFISVISSKPVFASTEVYKINDPFHTSSPTGYNFLYFQTYVSVPYKGGSIIVSRNPDGTGNADVGDDFYLGDILQNGFLFTYKAHSLDCHTHWQMLPQDITSFFTSRRTYTLYAQYRDACGSAKDISSLYIVQKNIPEPSPSPTTMPSPIPTVQPTETPKPTVQPTATPTPTPAGPQPFLDLPWNYHGKGFTFNDAALAINSFFDHTFPILSIDKVLLEPELFKNQVTTFENEKNTTLNYSTHDGYDYGRKAGAVIGEPVLAAAAGTATYVNSCEACGNMIEIDHHNGYQSRYMHLQKDGLITATPGETVEVDARQIIGKVGATGRVIPANDLGAHIHFMVVEDKNHNGNFNDNIPDGVVDPFGWQSAELDPWANYSFLYNGISRIGNTSYYLWKTPLNSAEKTIASSGGTIENGSFTLDFPAGAVTEDTQINLRSGASINLPDKESIGPKLIATAKNILGNIITQFKQAYTITVNFAAYDLTPFQPDTLSLYSSNDGITWERQKTVIDVVNKKATAQVDHFTQFALMADKIDTTTPDTTASLDGKEGQPNWFRSDVNIKLTAVDNQDGLGVDYTMYKRDDGDWEQYLAPITVTEEGHHSLEFYSEDLAGNIEPLQKVEFDLNKHLPEAKIQYNQLTSQIEVKPATSSDSITVQNMNASGFLRKYRISNKAGSFVSLEINAPSAEKAMNVDMIKNIQYTDEPPRKIEGALSILKSVKNFEQVYRSEDQDKVKLEYQPDTDKTNVTIWGNENLKYTDVISGKHTLTLTTHSGELLFTY